jgi:hypothetical protein
MMLWTFDSFRGNSQQALTDGGMQRPRENPLSSFYWSVDMMLYAAAAGFAACIVLLLVT